MRVVILGDGRRGRQARDTACEQRKCDRNRAMADPEVLGHESPPWGHDAVKFPVGHRPTVGYDRRAVK
jgi:hypothetical protein